MEAHKERVMGLDNVDIVNMFNLSWFSISKRLGLAFEGYLQPRGFLNKSKTGCPRRSYKVL